MAWIHEPGDQASFRCCEYWDHVGHLPFYKELGLERSDHSKTIPIAWHMDGVKVYKTHKAYVYSFSSLIRKGPSLDTKCLLLLVRDGDLVKPHTHNDIGILIGYIMKVLQTGKFPSTNERGEPFKTGSREATRAEQPFAGGWKCAFSAFKADLEARVMVHQLARNWAADSICEHCLASKTTDFSYGDFTDNAAYLDVMFDHHQFLLLNPPHRQSTWTNVRGWDKDRNLDVSHLKNKFCLDRFFLIRLYPKFVFPKSCPKFPTSESCPKSPTSKDMLHCLHQGVAPIAIASLITHHFEDQAPDLTLAGLNDHLASTAWQHYQVWKQDKREVVVPTSSRFSGQKFGREKWVEYPELSSCYKGAMVKYMIFWASAFLTAVLETNDNAASRKRAYCSYCLAQFQFLQEVHGPFLSLDVAKEMCHWGRSFLIFYQDLAVQARHQCPNRKMYKVVPKFHSLLHVCLNLPVTRRNPRYDHLYMDEDFMKHISKIACRCHPLTMHKVTLQRYRALIELCM